MSSKSRWRKATLRRQRAAFKAVEGPLFAAHSPLEGVTAADVIRNCEELRAKLGHSLIAECVAECFMPDGPTFPGLSYAPRSPLFIVHLGGV